MFGDNSTQENDNDARVLGAETTLGVYEEQDELSPVLAVKMQEIMLNFKSTDEDKIKESLEFIKHMRLEEAYNYRIFLKKLLAKPFLEIWPTIVELQNAELIQDKDWASDKSIEIINILFNGTDKEFKSVAVLLPLIKLFSEDAHKKIIEELCKNDLLTLLPVLNKFYVLKSIGKIDYLEHDDWLPNKKEEIKEILTSKDEVKFTQLATFMSKLQSIDVVPYMKIILYSYELPFFKSFSVLKRLYSAGVSGIIQLLMSSLGKVLHKVMQTSGAASVAYPLNFLSQWIQTKVFLAILYGLGGTTGILLPLRIIVAFIGTIVPAFLLMPVTLPVALYKAVQKNDQLLAATKINSLRHDPKGWFNKLYHKFITNYWQPFAKYFSPLALGIITGAIIWAQFPLAILICVGIVPGTVIVPVLVASIAIDTLFKYIAIHSEIRNSPLEQALLAQINNNFAVNEKNLNELEAELSIADKNELINACERTIHSLNKAKETNTLSSAQRAINVLSANPTVRDQTSNPILNKIKEVISEHGMLHVSSENKKSELSSKQRIVVDNVIATLNKLVEHLNKQPEITTTVSDPVVNNSSQRSSPAIVHALTLHANASRVESEVTDKLKAATSTENTEESILEEENSDVEDAMMHVKNAVKEAKNNSRSPSPL